MFGVQFMIRITPNNKTSDFDGRSSSFGCWGRGWIYAGAAHCLLAAAVGGETVASRGFLVP